MSRYSIPALHPGLTVIVGWDNPLVTFFAQVFDPSIEEDEEACLLWIGTAPEAIPTVAALQAQLAGWATIPPDIVDRLHPRSASGHAADPAPALGTPAPARRWGDPPRPCLTLSRAGATCSPPARDINRTTMEVFPMPTTQIDDTVPGHHRPHPGPAGAGHRALAAALGQRDGAAPQPLQPAVIPGHQRVAAHGDGLCRRRSGPRSTRSKLPGGASGRAERGVPVVFWKVYDHEDTETGTAEKRFVLRQYTVFNAAQLDGVAIPEITVLAHRFTPIERCAHLVDAMPQRPAILHGHQRAFYTPATDTLHLPMPGVLSEPGSVLRHACFMNWCTPQGIASRLNRSTLTDLCLFGDPTYAKEELVAEMGAAYLCGVCGIANATIDQQRGLPPELDGGPAPRRRRCSCRRQRRPRRPPITSRTSTPPRTPRTGALMPPRPVLGTVHVAPTPQRPNALKATSKSLQRNPGQGPPQAPPNPPDKERL